MRHSHLRDFKLIVVLVGLAAVALLVGYLIIPKWYLPISFHAAIRGHEYAKVSRMLNKHPGLIHAEDAYGDIGLCLAVETYDLQMIKILVEAGSPIDFDGGRTGIPLVTVAYRGDHNMEILKYLLDQGADVNVQAKSRTSHAYGTPLHNAATNAQVDTVKLLLDRGADVNLSSSPKDIFPNALHAALWPEPSAINKRQEIIQLLLDAGADPTVPAANGETLVELSKSRFDGQNLFE